MGNDKTTLSIWDAVFAPALNELREFAKPCCKACDVGQRYRLKASDRIVTVTKILTTTFVLQAELTFDDGEAVWVVWKEFLEDADRID